MAGDVPMPHAMNTRTDVDPQQMDIAETVEDVFNDEIVVEDGPHSPSVAQSEGPIGVYHLAGDAPMPNAVEHVVDPRAANDSQQEEDAEAVEDVLDEEALLDGPHSPSVAPSDGQSGVHHLAGDEPVPYAVMAAGSVFVAGTLVNGAWCAAVTSPIWVPRVGVKCMRAAWSSWMPKKNIN